MEQQDIQRWQHLINQYLIGSISRDELDELLHKAVQQEEMSALSAVMRMHWEKTKEDSYPDEEEWEGKFQQMMLEAKTVAPAAKETIVKRWNWKKMAVAAAMLLAVGMSTYFILRPSATPANSEVVEKQDLLPGSNGAILTLANGEEIVLDSIGNGVLAIQGKTRLLSQNGQIRYEGQEATSATELFNTISTPRGRQFTLLLADGSKVWLNAASSLRYPANFSGPTRRVEVKGEAYFEIAKSVVPFVVAARGTEVQVLGTQFNINAYEDEAAIQTTLLEGKVKVVKDGESRTLAPGQQSHTAADGSIRVLNNVNTDMITAWKNGFFSFDQTDLFAVMRQLSRWYDVDVVYEGNIPDRRFGGEIPRNANASQVLQILEESNIHFKIAGKKIVVLP